MLFSEYERCSYAHSPLMEVICQLRFPTILSINAQEPAAFQEAVRRAFPRYAARQEQPAPKVVGLGGPSPKVEAQPAITNYSFVSADGAWKLNLTSGFIALSTLRYRRWESFAYQLDEPLAQFIQLYQPAFFERIGLRYVNAISRRTLGLEELLWDDLIQQPYLGILGEPDVEETDVVKCSVDIETALAGNCRMKIHAGPGMLQSGKGDREVRFILDGDFSTSGNLSTEQVPDRLEELHRYAVRLFRGAITNTLHDAMGPTPL
ncbi:MAG: TIGR04255 family protein [Oscillospiraceae bacterium]|nr:TIGR04255 family protein [Oscillospiraceae bacterium]